jgi:hypothetical protein
VALIWVFFLIISGVEHIFIYPLAIYMSSFEKRLFRYGFIFLSIWLFFFLLGFMNSLYILDFNLLPDHFVDYFFHSAEMF